MLVRASSTPAGAELPGGVLAMAQSQEASQGPPPGMRQPSCFCGSVKLFFSSEVIKSKICHCTLSQNLRHPHRLLLPPRSPRQPLDANQPPRILSLLFHPNHSIIFSGRQDTPPQDPVAGLKTYMKTVDSGNITTNYFCGECGSTLDRKSSGRPGLVLIWSGCVDDEEADRKQDIEILTDNKVKWVGEVEGTEHFGKAA